ncbi:MAG: hypothetical protein ABFD97_23505 [Syntrophobacter sp.]
MRPLLIVSAILEGMVGAALILIPATTITVLLGAPPHTPVGLAVTRGCGVALLSLGAAYWLARNETQSAVARGLVIAMLLYNGAFILILGHARIGLELNGIGLWPGIVLHVALVIWCVICLRREPRFASPAATKR